MALELEQLTNTFTNPRAVASGAMVEVARNLAANPSFEAASPLPAGGVRSGEWAAEGAWSLHVPGDEGYGLSPYGETPYGF